MKRRDILKSIGALLGLGTVAREALALQPESRPESTPLSFPDRSIVPTKAVVFDDREFHPLRFVKYESPLSDEERKRLIDQLARIDSCGAFVVPCDGELVMSNDDGVTWTLSGETPTRWRPTSLTIDGETIEIYVEPDATVAEIEMAISDALERMAR